MKLNTRASAIEDLVAGTTRILPSPGQEQDAINSLNDRESQTEDVRNIMEQSPEVRRIMEQAVRMETALSRTTMAAQAQAAANCVWTVHFYREWVSLARALFVHYETPTGAHPPCLADQWPNRIAEVDRQWPACIGGDTTFT